MTLQTRLAALERTNVRARAYEVLVRGGFPKDHGLMEATTAGEQTFISEPGEGLEEFRARVRREVGRVVSWVTFSGIAA